MKKIFFASLLFLYSYSFSQTFNKFIPLTHPMSGVSSIGSCDFDLDGDVDILATSKYGDELVWYENDGKGNFENLKIHTIANKLDGAIDAQIADMDKDGDLDVVCISIDDFIVSWFQNNGNGTFGPKKIIANTVEKCVNFQLADLNNDGFFEIIYSTYDSNSLNSTLCMIKNNGNNLFAKPVLIKLFDSYSTAAREVFDFDMDGDNDLILNDKYDIFLLENDGTGTFSKTDTIVKKDKAFKFNIVDINNDKILDIVYSSYKSINAVLNYGNKKVSAPITLATNVTSPKFIELKDLNNDGLKDLIWSHDIDLEISEVLVKFNQGNNTFDNQRSLDRNILVLSDLFVDDVDKDGKNDIIISSSKDSQIGWYKNLDLTSFSKINPISSIDAYVGSVVSFDTDNDGDNDIISLSTDNGKVAFYENDSNKRFLNQRFIYEFENPLLHIFGGVSGNITPVDYNKDGLMDCFITYGYHSYNSGSSPVSITLFLNKGKNKFVDTVFSAAVSEELLTGYASKIVVSDIDNDFDDDLLFFYTNNKTLSILKNRGNNVFDKKNIGFNDVNFQLADFNNDNYIDITGGTEVIFNTKSGEFKNVARFDSLIFGSYYTTILDVDNDGTKDMIGCIQDSNAVYWYKNTYGKFSPKKLIQNKTPGLVYQVVSADLNLDGYDDLVFRTQSGIFWYENLKNSSFSTYKLICPFSSDFILKDKDGDGDLDILLYAIVWVENTFTKSTSIVGSVFYDVNKNKIKDKNELGVPNLAMAISPANKSIFTDNSGYFSYNEFQKEGVKSKVELGTNQFSLTTDSLFYTVYPLSKTNDTLFFGVLPIKIVDSVETSLVATKQSCSGFYSYQYTLNNKSDKKRVFTTSITVNGPQTLVSSSLAIQLQSNSSYELKTDTLQPFQTYLMNIITKTDNLSVSDSVISLKVLTSIDTLTLKDSVLLQLKCDSTNFVKSVSPRGFSPKGIISKDDQWLTYAISFSPKQKGIYSKEVRIEETLDSHLDINSFTFLNANFPVQVEVLKANNKVIFKLPSDFTNQSQNTLHIEYKLKVNPQSKSGDSIVSQSVVLFNMNARLVSNRVLNTLFDCNSIYKVKLIDTVLCLGTIIQSLPVQFTVPVNYAWKLQLNNKLISKQDLISFKTIELGEYSLSLVMNTDVCSLDTLVARIKIEDCAGLTNSSNNLMKIYPLPADDFLTISFSENASFLVELYDQSGRKSLSQQVSKSALSHIDVSNLEPSIYILLVENIQTKQKYSCKVMIR